jgi:hypothetical protein
LFEASALFLICEVRMEMAEVLTQFLMEHTYWSPLLALMQDDRICMVGMTNAYGYALGLKDAFDLAVAAPAKGLPI